MSWFYVEVERIMDLSSILTPIGEHGVGDDPAYSDVFFLIKNEIDNPFEINHQLVIDNSLTILSVIGKDVRVACYLLKSMLYVCDSKGLDDGLKYVAALVERFGAEIYPRRVKSIENVLLWLNGNDVENCLKTNGDMKINDESVVYLENMIKSKLGVVEFSLSNWLKLVKEECAENKKVKPVLKRLTSVFSSDEVVKEEPISILLDIHSMGDVKKQVKKVLSYYKLNNHFSHHVYLTRAMRWSVLSPEVDKGKRTGFVFSSNGQLESMKRIRDIDPVKAFWIGEECFMSSGGHVNFDLQKELYEVALAMGDDSLANLIYTSVFSLMSRLPDIIHYKYQNGNELASKKTIKWLEEKSGDCSEDVPINKDFIDEVGLSYLDVLVKKGKYMTAIKFLKVIKINILSCRAKLLYR